jgi:hypothetical protein
MIPSRLEILKSLPNLRNEFVNISFIHIMIRNSKSNMEAHDLANDNISKGQLDSFSKRTRICPLFKNETALAHGIDRTGRL